MNFFKQLQENAKQDEKVRNRYFVLILGGVFFLNYLMFCALTEKNVFDIVPTLPKLVEKKEVKVYLSSIDAKKIIEEKRMLPSFENKKALIRRLFKIVVSGSKYENTSQIVPMKLYVRKIWLKKNGNSYDCYIDLDPGVLTSGVIKDSEKQFLAALNKTLKTNIPSVASVTLLNRGISGIPIWEL